MASHEAFEERYDAYSEGVDAEDNPYGEGTDECVSWSQGWVEARNHDYDEIEE